jgi:hypothetical protein
MSCEEVEIRLAELASFFQDSSGKVSFLGASGVSSFARWASKNCFATKRRHHEAVLGSLTDGGTGNASEAVSNASFGLYPVELIPFMIRARSLDFSHLTSRPAREMSRNPQ